MIPLQVIVLAAGLSQRLGYPKQLVRRHGVSLLDHTVSLVQTLQPALIQVILPTSIKSQIIEQAPLSLSTGNPIWHANSGAGLASSIRLGCEHLAAQQISANSLVLLTGVDQLALTANHLHQLYQVAQAPQIAVSHYATRWGVPVILPWGVLQQVRHQLTGDTGLKQLWPQLQELMDVKAIFDPTLVIDLDTPADFVRWQRQYRLARPL